ncbi:hypothetical protein MWU75_00420 [Ornithinimicrobium sp. F0845]|uniref:hypothetical protein n=1 Tax=Ornithinimicrobium sp. F0845 TaxID=2926412 RepID=UPI001FF10F2D|nr:hypothetical protein [Ornithinimicrobium sp. F0845]MCK0110609.1 hypothetical protein [Ornithinimicrobium sp. F0845]
MPAWHEATWVDPDGKKKRGVRMGWLWLLLIPAVLILFSVARFNDYWQYDDFTVTTVACEAPLAEGATWSDMDAAGCEESEIPGIEIRLLDGGRPAEDVETDGTTWQFGNMPSAFTTLGLDVYLEESAGRVFIADASTTPPTVLREMRAGDVDRTVFARNLGDIDTLELYLVVAPR